MTDLKAWLVESIERAKQPSSPYFKYWGKINLIILISGAIPQLMLTFDSFFEVKTFDNAVPHPYWIHIFIKILIAIGAWGKISGGLTIVGNHKIIDDNGVLIQKVCDELPYTEKKTGIKLVEPQKESTL